MNSKTTKTAMIMVASILSTIVSSLCSLIVTGKILSHLGSDYNGVNATATQIVTILTLLEGGFTLASQVALYGPVAQNDQKTINGILSLTSKRMYLVGLLMLVAGVLLAAGYSFFVKSALGYWTILAVIFLAVLAAAINIGVISKYRILFQVTQTEYLYGYANIAINLLQTAAVFVALDYTKNVIAIRSLYFFGELVRYSVIVILAKRMFRWVDYRADIAGVEVTGTRDVFVSQITSMFYNTAPVLFISTFVGTVSTSVYTVYYSVTNIILGLLTNIVNAPTNGLGQLIASSDSEEKHKNLVCVFREYELTNAFINAFLCSVMFVLLLPFVRLYTREVTDASYVDPYYAVVMVLITMMQILHMPSGICMQVAGRFKAVKCVQSIAAVVVTVSMLLGVLVWEMKGLLLGKLLTAVVLSVCEVSYAYRFIIRSSLKNFLGIFLATYMPAVALCAIEFFMIQRYLTVESWLHWILLAVGVAVANGGMLLAINCVANRATVGKIAVRLKNMLRRAG